LRHARETAVSVDTSICWKPVQTQQIGMRDSRIRRYVDLLEARTDSTDRHVYARIRLFVPELREPKVAEAGRGGDVLV